MRLRHYRRNFLHRRVMLNYTNSLYVRNCLHRNVGFNTFYETEQLRTEFPASSRSAKFIYLLLNYHVHYQINQLHEIGKDLKWRTTYLNPRHSPSSVSMRLVDVASVPTCGRRSRALLALILTPPSSSSSSLLLLSLSLFPSSLYGFPQFETKCGL